MITAPDPSTPSSERTGRLVVVGGGFAGVAAAASAVALPDLASAPGRLAVVLVTATEWMTIRPRLYETDPADARVHLPGLLAPLGIDLIVGTATRIDAAAQVVRVEADPAPITVRFDSLVLAAGSRVRRPGVTADAALVHDVDTYEAAIALRDHVRKLAADAAQPTDRRFSAVVVGGGLAGIETATELAGTLSELATAHGHPGAARILLVDPAATVAELLGPASAGVLEGAFRATGVEPVLGRRVAGLDDRGAVLDDGSQLAAGTVVWTAGLEASALAAQLTDGLDAAGRIRLDRYLRVPGLPSVFAAGDVGAAPADDGRSTVMSCQHAIPTGQVAGRNAAAAILGQRLEPFRASPYVTCVDLGAAGGLFTVGWDREPRATGAAGKEQKQLITDMIHPLRWIGGASGGRAAAT